MNLIGSGSFGEVFEKDGKAIKILRDKGYKNTLCSLREIDVFSKIRGSEYCIQADTVELLHNGNVIFVMDRGVADMTKIIRHKRVTDTMILHAALGLEFLHAKHLIHGDFKPSNVVVFDDGSAKIIDFGFTMKGPLEDIEEGLYPDVYQAPEIRKAANYSRGIDVWSFGVFFLQCKYFLCMGEYHRRPKELLRFLDTLTAEYLKTKGADSDTIELILGLLNVDPKKRIPITAVGNHFASLNDDFKPLVAKARLRARPSPPPKLPELDPDVKRIIEEFDGITSFVRNATIVLAKRSFKHCDLSSMKKKYVFAVTCAIIMGKYYSPINNEPGLIEDLTPIIRDVRKLELHIVFNILKGMIVP